MPSSPLCTISLIVGRVIPSSNENTRDVSSTVAKELILTVYMTGKLILRASTRHKALSSCERGIEIYPINANTTTTACSCSTCGQIRLRDLLSSQVDLSYRCLFRTIPVSRALIDVIWAIRSHYFPKFPENYGKDLQENVTQKIRKGN